MDMAIAVGLGKLKTGEWEQLQDAAERLERAWKDADSVDLHPFLPAIDNPLHLLVLQELVKVDLEIRWRRGQGIRLEDYLEKYPALGTVRTVPARLIYEEYRVRQMVGDRPGRDTYQERFADQFAELQRLIADQPIDALATGTFASLVPRRRKREAGR